MSIGTMGISIKIPFISDIYDLLKNAWNLLCSIPNIIISGLSMILSMLLYGIQQGLFILIDCVNMVFRRIAGLDIYYVNGVATEGDIVYSLLQNPVVTSVFTSVLVASIFLLFVTTFIAVFKTEFDMSKSNAKGPIIGRAIKSILYFACVPIICILGVYISNVFLRTFDAATSQGAHSMSAQVFAAASYDGNRARNDCSFANRVKSSGVVPGITINSTQAEVANAIDDAFRVGSKANGIDSSDDRSTKAIEIDVQWRGHMQAWAVTQPIGGIFLSGTVKLNFNHFSINNILLVYYFYDLVTGYNYLIGYLGSFMVAMLLLSLIIGVIQRIFELVILFVVSPAFVATMPLDEGARFGKWKDAFVKRTMSAYGPVIGINLLFMALTLVQDIYIFDPNMFALGGLFNCIVQCLFIIVGLLAVKDFSAMISELVGSNDALAQGESKKADVAKLGGKVATAGALGVRMGAKTAAWAGRKAGTAIGNYRGQKAVDENNAKIDAAEQQALAKIKANWRGISDDEAKKKLEGWKNGTLTGADKVGMDALVKSNKDTFDTAKKEKEVFTKKKAPKLSLMDELDALDDTITGGIRSKAKESHKNHTNPIYALMGDELKKTRYSSHHKKRAEEDAVKDAREKREHEMVAATIVDAKKIAGSIDDKEGEINVKLDATMTLIPEVEALINALKAKPSLTPEEQVDKNLLESTLKELMNERTTLEAIKTSAKESLDKIGKMKNFDIKELDRYSSDVARNSAKINESVSKLDDLQEKLNAVLRKHTP